ncbi:MAG: histidine kinase dimerization/phosphoacceptor domain -containing protein [Fluviicola sp.]|jgi:two-component sensor histidine kinase
MKQLSLLFFCLFPLFVFSQESQSCTSLLKKYSVQTADSAKLVQLVDEVQSLINNDYETCICICKEGIKRSKLIQNDHLKFSFMSLMGYAKKVKGDYNGAIESFLQILKQAETSRSEYSTRSTMSNLASTYLDIRNYKKAEYYYLKSYSLLSKSDKNFKVIQNRFYVNYGYLKDEMQQHDSAIYFFNKAEKNFQGDDYEKANLFLNKGRAYMNLKQNNLAKINLEKAEKLFKEYEDVDGEIRIHLNLAEILLDEKKYIEAKIEAELSLKYAFEISSDYLRVSAYDLLSRINEASGQMEQALIYNKKYHSLNDSLLSTEKEIQIDILQESFEGELKDRKISSFKKQIKLKEKQKWIYILIIGFITLSAFGLVFILYLWKRKNSRLKSLVDQKNHLMSEIHHRVKNNLQLISSLLDLQLQELSDEQAIKALTDSRNRVLSMSYLHQQLYIGEDVRYISTKIYFEKLIEILIQSMSKANEIQFETQVEDLNLSIDDAIPLGLIANELITNSIKYAFKDQSEKKISIHLALKNELLYFLVADNGVGMTSQNKNGFGLQIIRSLSRQMRAEQKVSLENGTKVELTIHKFNVYAKM